MVMTGSIQRCNRPLFNVRRFPQAFTLIELVTVIVIVGLIGISLGGPVLSYISSVRTRGAAARLSADIRYAQRWAMSTRNRTWVVFNVAGNSYTLYVEDPAHPGATNRQMLASALGNVTAAVNVGESPFTGAKLNSAAFGGTGELSFDSSGVPYDANGAALASNGQVQLAGAVTVTVRTVSGLVEVTG